jgi:hypothetical protein
VHEFLEQFRFLQVRFPHPHVTFGAFLQVTAKHDTAKVRVENLFFNSAIAAAMELHA